MLSAECTGAPRVWQGVGWPGCDEQGPTGLVWGVCFGEQLVLSF